MTFSIFETVKKVGAVFGFGLLFAIGSAPSFAQDSASARTLRSANNADTPPRVAMAQRFLARRGIALDRRTATRFRARTNATAARPEASTAGGAWQPLGPAGVVSANFGLVTGRISSLAFDPADSTGNRLFAGTTGGGVWVSQNAGTSNVANVVFTPLTDSAGALSNAIDASISIGALTVQPGGTGVILAGTGDPNDALDSYYGAGILRSPDGGHSWTLIQTTADQKWSFVGEGVAGFAWSAVNPQLVVAAVSQAWEGILVDADRSNLSYEGLYYSSDGGATWHLARITDLNGQDVQGPSDYYAPPDGNAATSVVWNPVRGVFIAAVRFHGYYQSTDGIQWTRLAAQPGPGLTTTLCPTNPTSIGSPACPIYRGTLAVNPLTGDTFAWTVDENDQDQGIWQDVCAASGGSCTNPTAAFTKQWNTAAMETNTWLGAITIANGDYNLALAAIPSGQDTLLLAGGNDLWKCSLAMGCTWRNTTNATTCMSAQVGEYQHALAWNPAYALELFVGNDSGLWRSMDAIGETGSVCSSNDASHFQNMNGGLGSLAEVESMSPVGLSPYSMTLGLGANGTAGVTSTTGPTADWPQILGGEGGPVAIDPVNPDNLYVNNGVGVSIHVCPQAGTCTPAEFGSSPVVSNANVNGDGLTMTAPAPFLVDPADSTQLLVATCRMWRGPANGIGWTNANAVSSMFGGNRGSLYCSGNALVRSLAAMALEGGGEVVYVGTYGSFNGGATLPGHILRATMAPNGLWSTWQDLTMNPVTNDVLGMNLYGLDISSLFVDPHDASGHTVYATVAGIPNPLQTIRVVYRSVDGGGHWSTLQSNLPPSTANSLVVDPQDANTAYLAMDTGVYVTQDVNSCANTPSNCWTRFGSGLPGAPVVGLSAAPATTLPNVLAAATYGRGLWQIPLATAGTQLTTASLDRTTVDFGTQAEGSAGGIQTVTLTNTGGIALTPTGAAIGGANSADFSIANDGCTGAQLNSGAGCPIELVFTPSNVGNRAAELTISANLQGGSLGVALVGMGAKPGSITLDPTVLNFDLALSGPTEVGTTSRALQVTINNAGGVAVHLSSVGTVAPFAVASNSCGNSVSANASCQVTVAFAPTKSGAATQKLTFADDAGTQTVVLSGTGAAPPTDTLSPTALAFPATITGQLSAPLAVTLTNSGDLPLTNIAASASGPFQLLNNCTTQLAANSGCTLSVTFLPSQIGLQTGTLTMTDAINAAAQTVSLSGTGLLAPVFAVNPISLNFAGQPIGIASTPSTLTVTNGGGAPMANIGFQITGQSVGGFSTGTTTCGATLSAGASCTVQVIFTPSSSGGAAATLTVSSSTGGVKPATVPLSGAGLTAAGITVTPTQLSFAALAVGQSSSAQTVTISNTGGTSAAGFTLTVSGPFSLARNTCGASLAAGASCTAGVIFMPTSTGSLSGLLTITSSTVTTPATVVLSGIGGITGAVNIMPAQVSFPNTGVGVTSNPVTVTISNSSAGATLSSFSLFTTSGFNLTSNTCGVTLAPGASCTVGVAFAPTTAGSQSGNLTIASNSLAANATVPLSGMGFDFQATTTGSASQTVASGQTASYALSLAPSAGVGATFTFSCGSLPSYAACVFNPSSATVAANSTGTATVQITTSQSTSAVAPPPLIGGWRTLPLALGLLILPLMWRRRKLLRAACVVGLLSVAASGCSSSGGGSGGKPPSSPTTHSTPAGTYSIPVAVTADGVQHTVTLTLVVD